MNHRVVGASLLTIITSTDSHAGILARRYHASLTYFLFFLPFSALTATPRSPPAPPSPPAS